MDSYPDIEIRNSITNRNRPDRIAAREKKKSRGWDAWMEKSAAKWMLKLVLSHMVEIVAEAEGYKFARFNNHIPPKPLLPEEQEEVLQRFRKEKSALLDKHIKQFAQLG